jgi:hypothetical protein
MNRSKKIFVGFAIVFFLSLVAIVIDISRKTTFPGSKKKQRDSIEQKKLDEKDSDKSRLTPKSAAQPL